jgi:hypothetical protein
MTMTSYTGWIRAHPGGAWQVVCLAPTFDDAWRQLLDVRADAPTCDKVVNDGRYPEARRRDQAAAEDARQHVGGWTPPLAGASWSGSGRDAKARRR